MVGFNAMSNNYMESIATQIQRFRQSDLEREQLLESLIGEFQKLERKHEELELEFESTRASRISYQRELIQAREQLQQIENNSFVLALLDGDGVIFQDALLNAGVNGGAEAASKLQEAIRAHIGQMYPESGRWSIMVQVYVSLDKLGQKLHQVGLISNPQEFRAFAQSFNVNQPLFSIIDVGYGKERADHKIKEMLRTFSQNPTCKHIIFGGCHDAGYLVNLDAFRYSNRAASITLLESAQTHRGFADLANFRRTSFDNVFRSEPLPHTPSTMQPPPGIQPPPGFHQQQQGMQPLPPMQIRSSTENIASSGPLSPLDNVNGAPVASPPVRHATAPVAAPAIAPAPKKVVPPSSTASPVNGKEPETPNGNANGNGRHGSWSSVSKTGAANGTYNIKTNTTTSKANLNGKKKKIAWYNKDGRRLDAPLPSRDKAAAESLNERMRKSGKNLCNHWHLNKGRCNEGEFCKFQHGPKLSAAELVALQYKARSIACRDVHCENIDCYLGHQCSQERDSGYCSYGNQCHLKQSHGMDKVKYEAWEEGATEPIYAN